ncbi:MAG TPA: ubiquinone biosynthesis protein UbiB, partial [Alphaproteobacteria bacterium]|nr:ubiquinone biosynthesis protein UbiB [Alphaproteobacteria bacterium]
VEFRVPPVDWDRTAQTVMTAEWVEGISLKDRARLIEAGHDLKLLAARVIQTFLRQALNRGFFHADMHPGNLFVDAKGMLVAVDYGITGRLDAAMRRFMAETLHGFLMRDYRRIADIHFAVGFVAPPHTRDDFAQALRAV